MLKYSLGIDMQYNYGIVRFIILEAIVQTSQGFWKTLNNLTKWLSEFPNLMIFIVQAFPLMP